MRCLPDFTGGTAFGPMHARHLTYWTATLLLCAFMAYVSYNYMVQDPRMMAGFQSLGYPPYFPTILGVAKMLGVIALLAPGLPHLKEWAYAGFTFTFVGAIFSHLSSGQHQEALLPLISLFVLTISYASRPAARRPVLQSEAEAEHDHIGGLPIR